MYDISESNVNRALGLAASKMSQFYILATEDARIMEELKFHEEDINTKEAEHDIRSVFYSIASKLNAQAYGEFIKALKHEDAATTGIPTSVIPTFTPAGGQTGEQLSTTDKPWREVEAYSDPEADKMRKEVAEALHAFGRPNPADAVLDEEAIQNSIIDDAFTEATFTDATLFELFGKKKYDELVGATSGKHVYRKLMIVTNTQDNGVVAEDKVDMALRDVEEVIHVNDSRYLTDNKFRFTEEFINNVFKSAIKQNHNVLALIKVSDEALMSLFSQLRLYKLDGSGMLLLANYD